MLTDEPKRCEEEYFDTNKCGGELIFLLENVRWGAIADNNFSDIYQCERCKMITIDNP